MHSALCLFLFETNSKNKQIPIIVTHKDKTEDKNKLKKYNMNHLCILYIIVSLLSRQATLLALRDETKTAERETTIYSLLFLSYSLEDHLIS